MRRIAVVDATDLILKALSEAHVEYQGFTLTTLKDLEVSTFDGLILSGGQDFTQKLGELIQEFHAESKPICAIGKAVTLLAITLGKVGVTLAGNESEKTGAFYEACATDDFVTDREHKAITTPGAPKGIQLAINEFVEMA